MLQIQTNKQNPNADAKFTSNSNVAEGDLAPQFSLPDQDGNIVSLADYYGKQSLVLFFYPKDYSPNCTLESIAFLGKYKAFVDLGAEVLGVSDDSPESHNSFCQKLNLHFRLLTDKGHKVRDEYGEKLLRGKNSSRVTYVIDKHGIVRMVYAATFWAGKHSSKALMSVRSL